MSMKNKNKKLIFILTAMLGVVIVLVLLNNYNESRKAELFQLRKNIKSLSALPDDNEIQKRSERINQKRQILEPLLFDESDPVVFIEAIEGLASQNAVSVFVQNAESVNLGESSFGAAIKLSVTSGGSLANLRELLFAIENIQKEVHVNAVRISRNDSSSAGAWSMSFTVTAKTK